MFNYFKNHFLLKGSRNLSKNEAKIFYEIKLCENVLLKWKNLVQKNKTQSEKQKDNLTRNLNMYIKEITEKYLREDLKNDENYSENDSFIENEKAIDENEKKIIEKDIITEENFENEEEFIRKIIYFYFIFKSYLFVFSEYKTRKTRHKR